MPAPKGHPPYNTNGEGGRPRRFTEEFIEKEADAFEEWMQLPTSLWYKDFAIQRGYDPNELSEWAQINERFRGVYKKSQNWQQSLLIRGGLLNKFNPNITKLVLANTCGWTDKQQISGDSVNPLECILKIVEGSSKDLVDGSPE